MKKIASFSLLLVCTALSSGCARQSTPSMMNNERPQLVSETNMEQMPVSQVTNGYLYNVADKYKRFGTDTLHLSLGYDPADKSYGAMKAYNDLAEFKGQLAALGVRSVSAETVKTSGAKPTLMVSYDAVTAQAPAGCRNMPGFEDGLTTAEIGSYKFGCSLDAMLAKQIYRPTDMAGVSVSEPADGRRSSNTVEYYRVVDPKEAEGDLKKFTSSDAKTN